MLGVVAAEVPGVKEALSWGNAATSLLRAVFPDKPEYRYGQTVTEVAYGKSGSSLSTVTILGDIYIDFGVVGVVCLGLLYGLGFRVAAAAAQKKVTPLVGFAVVVVASCITALESQPVLSWIGRAEDFLAAHDIVARDDNPGEQSVGFCAPSVARS